MAICMCLGLVLQFELCAKRRSSTVILNTQQLETVFTKVVTLKVRGFCFWIFIVVSRIV